MVFAELPSIRNPTRFVQPSQARRLSRSAKCALGVAHLSRMPIMTGHGLVRGLGSLTIRIISLLMLAVVLVRGGSASAEAEHKRMMIATRNCRSVANTFMIKVKNTRCSFLGQEKSNIFMEQCSTLASRVEDLYALAGTRDGAHCKRLAYPPNFAPGST